MGEPRINDYAFLSDGHAPALVSRNGCVDWWCPPRADQPSVFGRLLGEEAGHWSLGGGYLGRPPIPPMTDRGRRWPVRVHWSYRA